jgi:histone H3/H4
MTRTHLKNRAGPLLFEPACGELVEAVENLSAVFLKKTSRLAALARRITIFETASNQIGKFQ